MCDYLASDEGSSCFWDCDISSHCGMRYGDPADRCRLGYSFSYWIGNCRSNNAGNSTGSCSGRG